MRCCVCGWADADAEHELGHLKSQYYYLSNECARLRAELADVYRARGGNEMNYTIREILHSAFALGVTVVVAVAAELTGIQSFEDVTLAGLAVTAVRSLATAIVTLGSRHVIRGS
jgi:hypothetical protein